jgi:phytoene desaturase
VRGIRLTSGEIVRADRVVCNADLPVAYRTLLPGTASPRAVRSGTYSPSCVVWHIGLHGTMPNAVEHHNIHFGRDWEGSFRSIIKDGRLMRDPSVLVTVPTRSEPGLAPTGGHVLYVLEPVPNLDGHVDWTTARHEMRDRLRRKIEQLGYRGRIDVESMDDPTDWERRGMERGTPFSLSHRFAQTGPFRPSNRPRRAPGLVFVGSGSQPGVGVPMVLVSGQLAAQRIEQLA